MESLFTSLELIDLEKGEGQWKNMQKIIRQSFKICFEHIDSQNRLLKTCSTAIINMKSQLASQPTLADIDKLIEAKLKILSKGSQNKYEIDDINGELTKIKIDFKNI